ncbi:MAG: glycosyltransferase [Candidatus Dojkabacteria bacterium]|nr:MAG: glycosyltransferase [Candidatus Dojkabacteria bacterium]
MKSGAIAFVAAGSGGHIQSALAVLEFIVANQPELAKNCIFVGSNLTMEGEVKKESLEESLCKRMNIPFVKVRGGKFQRQLSIHSLKLFLGIIFGFFDSWKFFTEHKPAVVVSFGGYSSLPMGFVAWMRNVPFLIHEQTTSIGLTNRLLKRFANISAISYVNSRPFFKGAKEVVMTGSPSREYLFKVQTVGDLKTYLSTHPTPLENEINYISDLEKLISNTDKYPLILMSGGSQGSHMLNHTILPLLNELTEHHSLFIQTGDNQLYKDYDVLMAAWEQLSDEKKSRVIIRKFIYEEFGILYKHSSLYIGRSGANSVYEVGMMGIPAVFIPIPWVTKNEQFTNAKIIEDLGFATILHQDDLTPESLKAALDKMEKNSHAPPKETLEALFPKNAAELITNEVIKLLEVDTKVSD